MSTWVEFLSKKIARNVGILSKLKHFLPIYIMNTLYYSLILSHLQYCTLLWANTYSTCLNKLRILQKKAIRIITQSHYLAHTDPLFSKLKLLKLDDLYKHQLGIYMYKSTKGLLPDSMSSMVIPIHNVHDHHLRNQNGYYIQHVRTNCRKFTIHYTGPVFWKVYVDVGRGRRRPQSNWHVASFTVKTVQWALSETANMQLRQRDELRYICTRFLCDFCRRVKWKLHNLTLDVAS